MKVDKVINKIEANIQTVNSEIYSIGIEMIKMEETLKSKHLELSRLQGLQSIVRED